MKIWSSILICVGCLAACSDGNDTLKQETTEPRGIAIVGVTVIDAVNGVRENQAVVFEGDRIIAVQSAAAPPAALQTIDAHGKYLIPGLWDMHIHLTSTEFFEGTIMNLLLSYGITSVRDTGGYLDEVVPIAEQSNSDGNPGPRVFYSGPLLDGEFVVYDGSSLLRPLTGTANTMADKADEVVTRLKDNGVSFVKIYEMVTPEVFAAFVDAANDAGLPIAAHIPLSTLASESGRPLASMEHMRNVLLDCALNAQDLLGERLEALENPGELLGGELRSAIHADQRPKALANFDEARCNAVIESLGSTIQVPTMSLNSQIMKPYFRDDWQDALDRLPGPARSVWSALGAQRAAADDGTPVPNDDDTVTFADRQFWLLQRMHELGVPIGAGTDVPVPPAIPGYNLHLELAILVRAGLSPLEAIAAATLRPAEFFAIEDEMGSIDVGKRADFLLLDENPLLDIENTRAISTVVTKGIVFDKEDLARLIQQTSGAAP